MYQGDIAVIENISTKHRRVCMLVRHENNQCFLDINTGDIIGTYSSVKNEYTIVTERPAKYLVAYMNKHSTQDLTVEQVLKDEEVKYVTDRKKYIEHKLAEIRSEYMTLKRAVRKMEAVEETEQINAKLIVGYHKSDYGMKKYTWVDVQGLDIEKGDIISAFTKRGHMKDIIVTEVTPRESSLSTVTGFNTVVSIVKKKKFNTI